MHGGTAAARWARDLAKWEIPEDILDQAPASPWVLPPSRFAPSTNPPSESTTEVALTVLAGAGPDPTVLDVGCGAGRASLHLSPPAAVIVGVDEQQSMLDRFSAEAATRGVEAVARLGSWLDIESSVPTADLVICSQVLYNVPRVDEFVRALHRHARSGVVIELDAVHPLSKTTAAWKRFWNLDRPSGPTAEDLLDVLAELDIAAEDMWTSVPDHKSGIGEGDVERMRRRLCLDADRDDEIREFLEGEPRPPRRLATIWWRV